METQWLTIELKDVPVVQLVRCSRDQVLVNFSPVTGFPGSTGHFDWLRSSACEIVGVRYWPFDDPVHTSAVHRLLNKCRLLKYSVVDPKNRFISIYLNLAAAAFIENSSNDQDLSENGIYENQKGDMAICFEVDPSVYDSFTPDLDPPPQTPRG